MSLVKRKACEPVVVIGGGAAGIMAAGRAGQLGARVVLLEKNKTLGRKLAITGKGRCNITNTGDISDFIKNYPGNGQFLYSSLSMFSNRDLQKLLESLGVPLKIERGGRMFPESDKASDIVEALRQYLAQNSVEVYLEEDVTGICRLENGIFEVETGRELRRAASIIVTTGGKSYPATGSTGDGYKWAAAFGHTIVPLLPALVPLNIREEWVKSLQGLALKNVEVSVYNQDKLLGKEFGEMLFTHFGVSGPVILTLSRLVVKNKSAAQRLKLVINLKPSIAEDILDKRLQRDFEKFQRKQLQNALDELLPKRLIACVISESGLNPEKPVHQITKEERNRLLTTLTALTLTIEGPRSMAEAIITMGGVSLKEVNPKTMESKLINGLYFAGEILDIDGYTGGYNLQEAFSTGYAAGEHAARQYKENCTKS